MLLTVLVAIMVFAMALSLPGAAVAKKWKIGSMVPADSPGHKMMLMFADGVKERTDGRLVIDAFPAEQLGRYRELFDNVVRGDLESGLLPLSPEFDKRLQAAYTMYIAKDWVEGRKIYAADGWMSKLIEPVFLKLGIKPLGFYFLGMNGFGSTKGPVVMPEDIQKQNIKVRTWNPSSRFFFGGMGAQTVDISSGELFTALQTGVAHAQDNAPFLTFLLLRDVTKYYTTTNHMFEPVVLMINLDLWNSLSPDDQKAVQASAEEAMAWGNDKMEAVNKMFLNKMKEKGIQVTELTPEQRAAWHKFGIESWNKFEKVIGKDMMDTIRKNVKQ